jgi:hypothetical protein
MTFKVELHEFSIQVTERKKHITNEEMTKQALIIPFLQRLDYDVFNPLEVKPEYIADFGFKKGEKVDYAIFQNGSPIIFIEAKAATEKLDRHSSQLSRYFNATPDVKMAILTNGVEYKLFTDLTQDNIMDNEPFYVFKIESLSDSDIETIEKFKREKFNSERIMKFAEELIYMSNLNSTLKDLFSNPSDEFLRFLIKDFSNTRITTNVLDRFRPLVKKAINNTLLEIISENLSPKISEVALTAEKTEKVEEIELKANYLEDENATPKNGIITTKSELKSLEIVEGILKDSKRNLDDLKHKDTLSYFTIYNGVITKWFLRLKVEGANKYLITRLPQEFCSRLCPGFTVESAPKSIGESRIRIESVEQLVKIKELIVACFDEVSDH